MGPLEASCGCWNDAKGVCDETARAGALILGIVDGLRGSDRMGEKKACWGSTSQCQGSSRMRQGWTSRGMMARPLTG